MSVHKSRRQRTRRGGEDITPERNKPIVDQRCTKRDLFQKSRVITSSTLICFLPVPRRGIEIPASTTRNCGSKRETEQRDGIRNARRASFHRCREGEETRRKRRRRAVATGRQVAKRNTNRNPNTGTKGEGRRASWWTVIEVQGPWKWELRRSFGGDGRNDPRKNRETRMEGKRCDGKFQRKLEGKREMEGREIGNGRGN